MSLRLARRHIGQLLIAGFAGVDVPVDLRNLAREFDLGGIILFARNVESPDQVAELAEQVLGLAQDLPWWVSVDQEGGRVARLKEPFTRWPPMITLGRSGDAGLAERFAAALATELAAVGITLDYAPVLDIHTNPSNPAIGDRALGEAANEVARLGRVIIETLQRHHVAACGKHFPGHGDTSVDSHTELPVVEHDPERLRAVELVPFREAVAADVASIMTGHVLLPALDERQPATLSPAVLAIAREELGFDGVIFTDDLDMGAVADRASIETLAVDAIRAGCDGLLICGPDVHRQVAALEALIHALEDETLPLATVERSMARHVRMKERFLVGRRPRPARQLATARLAWGAHQAVAEEMAQFL